MTNAFPMTINKEIISYVKSCGIFRLHTTMRCKLDDLNKTMYSIHDLYRLLLVETCCSNMRIFS